MAQPWSKSLRRLYELRSARLTARTADASNPHSRISYTPLGTCEQNRRDASTSIEGPRYALVEHFSLAWKRRSLSVTGKPMGPLYLGRDKGKGGLYLPSPGWLAGPYPLLSLERVKHELSPVPACQPRGPTHLSIVYNRMPSAKLSSLSFES